MESDDPDMAALAAEFERLWVARHNEAADAGDGSARDEFTEFCAANRIAFYDALRLAARVEAAKGDAAAKAAAKYGAVTTRDGTRLAEFDFAAGWRAHERAIEGGSDE